jgi:hypothetical protein
MKHLKTKKAFALLAVLVVAVMAAIGAYAYFTTTGSGDATATVGDSSAVTLSGTTDDGVPGTDDNVYPGGGGKPVFLSVTNPSSGHQFVGTVHLTSVDAFAGPGYTNPIPVGVGTGKCDTSKFSMADVIENQDVPAGGPTALLVNGSLVMANDTSNNQDGCKNAILRLNLTSN